MLNTFILNALLDLTAVESAALIEQAFAANIVDESVVGDWEDMQIALGLLDERLTPQPHYVRLPDSAIKKQDEIVAQHPAEAESPLVQIQSKNQT